jgi:hypothetical protein
MSNKSIFITLAAIVVLGVLFVIVSAIPKLPVKAQFNIPTVLRTGETVTFTDGLAVTLFKIEDSRCKPDVQCIWAGELKAVLHLTVGGVSLSSEHYLSDTTQKTFDIEGYTFTLNALSETALKFTVVKAQ